MGGRTARREEESPDAREIERRNRASLGTRLSPVMKTAATARELARVADKATRRG